MKRVLIATVLAATLLGTGCVNRRQAAGVYVDEPMVELGVFTHVGKEGKAWVFNPMAPWEKKVRVWVTPGTSVVENGIQTELSAVKAGRKVRLVYELRRDGTGVAERIDIISKVTGEEPPDTDT
ncbi:MAG TPA: hypothetical protein VFZ09_01045 [Archangium sp.]|uniref:hypothetical protein n=1 Tax=Archangium sp. TaxID=1872627 RepID=UPI002E349A4D|nr:hypothetical protein [Archangium sp.]HEX5744794.1 hypothetical protein [Archangium sp.]